MNRSATRSVSRRAWLAVCIGLGAVVLLVGGICLLPDGAAVRGVHAAPPAAPPAAAPAAAPRHAAQSPGVVRLLEGNARFVAGQSQHPRQTPERRMELAKSQAPFAVILGCSDSRTPPEVLFDQGLGDLFVVRVAGNVLDDHALGSIEYAAEHLHAPLIVVLGHKRCGAVAAARATLAAGGRAEGHIESLVASLRPAVEATAHEDLEATCKANVLNVAHALRTSEPILRPLVDAGKLEIVEAYYDLDSGAVTLLGGK